MPIVMSIMKLIITVLIMKLTTNVLVMKLIITVTMMPATIQILAKMTLPVTASLANVADVACIMNIEMIIATPPMTKKITKWKLLQGGRKGTEKILCEGGGSPSQA